MKETKGKIKNFDIYFQKTPGPSKHCGDGILSILRHMYILSSNQSGSRKLQFLLVSTLEFQITLDDPVQKVYLEIGKKKSTCELDVFS